MLPDVLPWREGSLWAVSDDCLQTGHLSPPSLPSCVSTVKMWLDYLLSGTRRFYLFSLSPARPPYRLYLSSPLSPPWDLRECRLVRRRSVFNRAGYTHKIANVLDVLRLEFTREVNRAAKRFVVQGVLNPVFIHHESMHVAYCIQVD